MPPHFDWRAPQRDLRVAHLQAEPTRHALAARHLARNPPHGDVKSERGTGGSARGAARTAGPKLLLGPGMIQLELSYEWAPTKHLITGDDNTSFLGLQVGYTAFVF